MIRRYLRAITRPALAGWALTAAVMAASLLGPICARAGELRGEVSLASQLVDRGLAVTAATPSLQAAVSWSTRSGWSLGASAGIELRSPDHVVASVARLSRSWSLSENWQLQTGLVYYHYSGVLYARVYEPGVHFMYRDLLTFGVSSIHVVEADEPWLRPAADLNFHWPLAGGFYLSGGMGVAHYTPSCDRPGREHHCYYSGYYRYGHAGLLWSHGPWRVEFDRVMVNPDARRHLRGRIAASWLGAISRSF